MKSGKPAFIALYLAECKLAGFGAGESEYGFHTSRKWRFDLAWPDLQVAFEYEGGTWSGGSHTRGKRYASDCEKYNAAQIAGWLVIRGTADTVRSGLALTQLLDALQLRYEGESR